MRKNCVYKRMERLCVLTSRLCLCISTNVNIHLQAPVYMFLMYIMLYILWARDKSLAVSLSYDFEMYIFTAHSVMNVEDCFYPETSIPLLFKQHYSLQRHGRNRNIPLRRTLCPKVYMIN